MGCDDKNIAYQKKIPHTMGAVLSEFEQPADHNVRTSITNIEEDLKRLKGTIARDCVCHDHTKNQHAKDASSHGHDTKKQKGNDHHDHHDHHKGKAHAKKAPSAPPPVPHMVKLANCETAFLNTGDMSALMKACKGHENPDGITPHDAMGAIARRACAKDTEAYKECGAPFKELSKCMVEHKCDLAAPMIMHNRCEPEMEKLDKCLTKHQLPDPWHHK